MMIFTGFRAFEGFSSNSGLILRDAEIKSFRWHDLRHGCRTQVYRLMPAKRPLAPPGKRTQSATCGLLLSRKKTEICCKKACASNSNDAALIASAIRLENTVSVNESGAFGFKYAIIAFFVFFLALFCRMGNY